MDSGMLQDTPKLTEQEGPDPLLQFLRSVQGGSELTIAPAGYLEGLRSRADQCIGSDKAITGFGTLGYISKKFR